MSVQLCQGEGVTAYFRDLVEEAIERQGVEVDAMTSYYLVQMLTAFARADTAFNPAFSDTPLAARLGEALETGGTRQRTLLRQIGDGSLFVSGFFPDRLKRSLVDVDYYAALGGYAYGSLSRLENAAMAAVYTELAGRFLAFVEVLGEVSERSALSRPDDLLRLYERWLSTGSRRCGQRLIEQGVVPGRSLGPRQIQ